MAYCFGKNLTINKAHAGAYCLIITAAESESEGIFSVVGDSTPIMEFISSTDWNLGTVSTVSMTDNAKYGVTFSPEYNAADTEAWIV